MSSFPPTPADAAVLNRLRSQVALLQTRIAVLEAQIQKVKDATRRFNNMSTVTYQEAYARGALDAVDAVWRELR